MMVSNWERFINSQISILYFKNSENKWCGFINDLWIKMIYLSFKKEIDY